MATTEVRQSLGDGDATTAPDAQLPGGPSTFPYYRTRFLLALALVATAVLFWVVGRLFAIPHYPGFEASLFFQPSPARSMLVTGLAIIVGAGLATLIAGSVRFDAGLFGAAAGLAVLSIRGGPSRYVLLEFTGPGGYLLLAFELLLLFVFIALAWYGLWLLHRRGRLLADVSRDGLNEVETTLNDKLYALATQVITMMVIVLLLAPTDEKKQVLFAVGIGAVASSMIAYAVSPVRPSVWYWAGPLAVGLFGYLAAWMGADEMEWRDGEVSGFFAGLARPLPLDYASVGVAGSVFGYWMGRRARRAKEAAAADAAG